MHACYNCSKRCVAYIFTISIVSYNVVIYFFKSFTQHLSLSYKGGTENDGHEIAGHETTSEAANV